jgi:hypothetical protein
VPVPPDPEYTRAARVDRFQTDFAWVTPLAAADVLVVFAKVPA